MKKHFLIFIIFWCTWGGFAAQATAFTCSKDCNEQCGSQVMGTWIVEPLCFKACKEFATLQCYNISRPWQSSMGEMGHTAYPLAAGIMRDRFQNLWTRNLTAAEKRVLAPVYGSLVDRVVVHDHAKLMSTWGDAPFQVRVFNDYGQTYGHDIYLDSIARQADELDQYIALGHEMCHSAQYEARGNSLARFGRDYFEGYARAGGYAGNVMEQECQRFEGQVEESARTYMKWVDQHHRPWTLQVCNRSDLSTIYVALGWPHKLDGGFSLVPIRVSQGWFPVEKDKCAILLDGIDSAEVVDVFAMGHNGENWEALGPKSGPEYCVDPSRSFKVEEHTECPSPAGSTPAKVSFKTMTNPWRSDEGSVRTWSLYSRMHSLRVCNSTTDSVNATLLRKYNNRWRGEGWHIFEAGACKDFSLGLTDYPVYWYGFSSSRVWEAQDGPEFCIFRNDAFYFDQGDFCPAAAGGSLVKGRRVDVQAGQNFWNFQ